MLWALHSLTTGPWLAGTLLLLEIGTMVKLELLGKQTVRAEQRALQPLPALPAVPLNTWHWHFRSEGIAEGAAAWGTTPWLAHEFLSAAFQASHSNPLFLINVTQINGHSRSKTWFWEKSCLPAGINGLNFVTCSGSGAVS